jgi:hypothetical protein
MSPGFAALEIAMSGARKDDELLGRAGHRDIAVDRSFDACSDDACSERVWVDQYDEVELPCFSGQAPWPAA